MALPTVDLDRWDFLGSTGSLLVFEDKVYKRQFKMFPAAAVKNGSVGSSLVVWRARSLEVSREAINRITSGSRAEA